ncbi:helix-turn-helix domain-containing protein [Actinomadura sp. HBU206391]|uniref:helix-turn-helix domain-containing protein n=1 Tax=Actinomadura sp. HBU206391 TaxID=2731692 RepID=UPI0016500D61|nr:helix-turn-helix transcriptional regulator [Actinomadura sp. HBU206391]MBC6460843.1 helix-turn-helix domain-containing protein [Actinomadura sp. HBU206391]
MPHEIDPTSPLTVFADELRHARLAAGLSQEQLGAQLNYSEAQVGHIETGKRTPALRFAEGCDRLFNTNGYFSRLRERIEQMPSYPSWFGPWAKAEREAISLHNYEPLLVPGLLQKEAYAREILRGGRPRDTEEQIDALVAARLERQQILTWEDPPALWFMLDEVVLRWPIGEAKVMQEQLEHLMALAEHPQVTIQIVPLSCGAYTGLSGAFVIARFADRPDILYRETANEGQIVADPKQVAELTYIYDAIRACAMPVRQSVELIRKATTELWT